MEVTWALQLVAVAAGGSEGTSRKRSWVYRLGIRVSGSVFKV
jgi:hypothetical protein